MTLENVREWAKAAGWSGLYIEWAKPTGQSDWKPAKTSLTVPVTAEQIEEFAKLARADAFEMAARISERRTEERFDEYGTREYDTNACYYTGRRADEFETRDEEDEECAAAIRALAAAEKEPKNG